MVPMAASPLAASRNRPVNRRVLDPAERISEVLFGLIMVLTFTGSLSIAEAGREDIRAMLIGALGCNIAWGIIDGILYVMNSLAEKGPNLAAYQALLRAATPQEAEALIAEVVPPVIASVLEPEDRSKASAAGWSGRAADTGAPERLRRVGRACGVSSGVPLHASAGAAVHSDAERVVGTAHLQRRCHRHAVHRWRRVCASGRLDALDLRYLDGRVGQHPGSPGAGDRRRPGRTRTRRPVGQPGTRAIDRIATAREVDVQLRRRMGNVRVRELAL